MTARERSEDVFVKAACDGAENAGLTYALIDGQTKQGTMVESSLKKTTITEKARALVPALKAAGLKMADAPNQADLLIVVHRGAADHVNQMVQQSRVLVGGAVQDLRWSDHIIPVGSAGGDLLVSMAANRQVADINRSLNASNKS